LEEGYVLSEDVKTTRRTPGDRVLCLIPSGFARRVVDLLDAHYAADPAVDVVVDRRGGERRDHERRARRMPPPGGGPSSRSRATSCLAGRAHTRA
jgi:hypothetical protein